MSAAEKENDDPVCLIGVPYFKKYFLLQICSD